MRDRGVDRVLRDVALRSEIIVVWRVFAQLSTLAFHLIGGLPGAADDFADASHGLRIRGHHADRADVMKNILRADGFRANARIRKRDIFRN